MATFTVVIEVAGRESTFSMHAPDEVSLRGQLEAFLRGLDDDRPARSIVSIVEVTSP